MAPKKDKSPPSDPHGIFSGTLVFFIENGVQSHRLQIWKQKLVQMGAKIEDRFTKNVTHVFAMDANSLIQKLDKQRLIRSKAKLLAYQWLEDSLVEGEKASEDLYVLSLQSGGGESLSPKADNDGHSRVALKKSRISAEDAKDLSPRHMNDTKDHAVDDSRDTKSASSLASCSSSPEVSSPEAIDSHNKPLIIALGDDRRSFSYYKAIPVIEKLPFKIESMDQVKHLSGIGKSMQDHIQEIVTTGKLSKLEHFENDEKVLL